MRNRRTIWLAVLGTLAVAIGVLAGDRARFPSADVALAANDGKTRGDIKEMQELFLEYVAKGDLLFHGNKVDGVEIGSSGMACAMCHPNAADTHPYQFPKFQSAMSKFATLQEMINWCIEKPNAGKTVALDSDTMKALVAYITWSNRGAPLDPGKY
jgi:thiosulfate dehydrogenase